MAKKAAGGNSSKAGGKKAMTKTQTYQQLAEKTNLSRKQIAQVFDELTNLIQRELKGPGIFTLPGLLKITKVVKPAQPAREMTNPRTGEKMMVGPKPKRTVVKVRALKGLKAMVS